MHPNKHGALPNGQFAQTGIENTGPAITRPFTLQESLPYSPQTSTIPFISGPPSPFFDMLPY
jgi:cohesin loading factor subunit SCC2